MPVYASVLGKPRVLYTDSTLIVSGNSVNSGFLKMTAKTIQLVKTHTTGTYNINIDWSMDGSTVAFTETNILTANNTPVTKNVLAPYAKFTISASAANFTVHTTSIMT